MESFVSTGDGYTLLENQVQQRVDAMDIFDVHDAGDLSIPREDIDSVQSVITAAWSPS
jgi:hypothetical protein